MTHEEFTKLIESLKAQGMSDEDILGTLLDMFKEEKLSADDLEKAAGSLGYEVTEEFKKLASGEHEEGSEEIYEEEVEEAQEIPESREESEESEESEEEVEETEESEEESEESEEESEEDEKEEARKLYGLAE